MGGRSHLKGKSVLEHLREAREKGLRATEESHGVESPGNMVGGADAAKEAATVTLLIGIVLETLGTSSEKILWVSLLFLCGFLLWKVGRSGFLGWSRLERINRLIEDEKYEIEHNRDEEKAELTEIYRAKGFPEPLLSKVIDVLMADDNKLLGVMLEEELGVRLESVDHPLKQALGAGIGVFLSGCFMYLGMVLFPTFGIYLAAFTVVFISSYITSRIERIQPLQTIVWNLAITFLAVFSTYFISRFLLNG